MEITKSLLKHLIVGIIGMFFAVCHAQTNLNFTQVKATVEGAIQLYWNSTTNEVYEVDYADQGSPTLCGLA